MASVIERAIAIAVDAHKAQVRKTDASPYIVHPFMVALMLTKNGFSDEIVAVGLVHDVLEDSTIPLEQLREELGEEIVEIVRAVTEDTSLPWEERKQKYVEAVRTADIGAKAVSLCDKIHNLECLIAGHEIQGPAIWQKFNRGKEMKLWFEESMLKMFKETWQHPLIDRYESLVEKVKALT